MKSTRALLTLGLLSAVTACSSTSTTSTTRPARSSSVVVTNLTHATQCQEEDNVYFKLAGADLSGLRGMRIEARQPAYISQLASDTSKSDFTHCDFKDSDNPVYHFEPKRVVLWENERYLMLGLTYATFWRPSQVDVVVGDHVTEHVHLIQLFLKDTNEPQAQNESRYEFLVLYPPDGYWRAKPIPALPLTSSTYGTSFLVGPVRDGSRPIVELSKVQFVPEQLAFVLDYADGSHGTMQLRSIDRDKAVLDYRQDTPLAQGQALAAVRSMYVTPERSDVAELTYQTTNTASPVTVALPNFSREQVSEVNFGRSVVSVHNPSAPDMWFGQFTLQER